MEDSELQRATHGALVRRYMEGNPRWTVTFREAFEKYRGLAGWTLELACRASSTEGVREAPTSAPSSPHPAPVFSSR